MIELVDRMKSCTDPNVWGALLGPVRLLDKMVDGETRPKLQAFVKRVAQPSFDRLGWTPAPDEPEQLSTLRGVIVGALGATAEDPDIQREAAERYERYQTDPSALDPNVVEPVQVTLATTNDRAFYDQLYEKFSAESSTPQEKVNALESLACFTEPSLVQRTLKLISDGEVRTQDAPYTIRLMSSRRGIAQDVWNWCEAALGRADGQVPRQLDRPHARRHCCADRPAACRSSAAVHGCAPGSTSAKERRPNLRTPTRQRCLLQPQHRQSPNPVRLTRHFDPAACSVRRKPASRSRGL